MNYKQKGKIISNIGGLYGIELYGDSLARRIINCRARGLFRHTGISPVCGDEVTVSFGGGADDSESNPGGGADSPTGGIIVEEIAGRKNFLIRPPLANLDYLFIVTAPVSPSPVPLNIDKLTCVAEHNAVEPVIIINKTELDRGRAEEIAHIYRTCGFDVFKVSCATGEGMDELREFISSVLKNRPHGAANHPRVAGEPGEIRRTGAFAGASGVGKSSLIQSILPWQKAEVSEVGKRGHGRHTTRQVSLYPVCENDIRGGYIADTPGFSLIDFDRFNFIEPENLAAAMREMAPYLGSCKYTKCTHTKEEGCAVIQCGIPKSRRESYLLFYEGLKNRKKYK